MTTEYFNLVNESRVLKQEMFYGEEVKITTI